ncbi:flagellar basal-body MS-ring/collar protein FliF [Ancylobacter sp. WKF20]|uniref:flagellar basal-body MS-ring/collar protein FliF n=1 Tax=Ancylobacter sp. WKF20 TaxID=3039801 RepID=UPI00243424C1|nr:flagellar basal-body MS-ring/collar protein FliF [Ancylobacter sp. WKF20]WGD28598.1 flagellar basal-body MS-ring/collar protein FliF [Ancylobacter sp. WKF20]
MIGGQQIEMLLSNLRQLGARRLIALGLIGLTVLAAISLGAYFLSRPATETLYANLNREDVTRIGGALKDAGVTFDVNSDGTAVLVAPADTARARMLLAEKGLPQSSSSGYELFNDMNSLGLTSFMQEITKVRALEGELARTIQTMKGVKAARVHIVLPDRGSFRREQQQASASVVIRTEAAADASSADAIRHLVAAALPGMKMDSVTVLNTEGAVLAAGDDPSNAAGGKKALLQDQVNRDTEAKIRRALTPYLGIDNFQISVSSRLDTDRVTMNETTFDPASKTERSVRVIKETGTSQNRSQQQATSVQQNIPQQQAGGAGGAGNNSNEENNRREELTNFEISSRSTETVREGFTVENLSIAILVNRERLVAAGDAKEAVPLETQIYEIEQLAGAAAGFDKARGDKLKVSAVAFAAGNGELEPVPPLSWTDVMMRQAGTLVNAATILIVAALLIWFGLKPAVRAIVARPEEAEAIEAAMLAGPGSLAAGELPAPEGSGTPGVIEPVNLIEDLTSKMNRSPQKRLEQIVEFDEEQAAAILRQWLQQEVRA